MARLQNSFTWWWDFLYWWFKRKYNHLSLYSKTPTSGAWNLVVPVVKGDESKRFLEFALGSFALQGCGGGLNNTDTLFYYLEKHINKGYNVTILPKVIESTYLDDFQYLDSNVKIETLLENSIDLINYRKGKLDWIFKEYIRLSNKYSLV